MATKQWTKGTFIPALTLCGPVQPIPAWLWCDYAVHYPVGACSYEDWVVSYVPLGMKCGIREHLHEAQQCAEEMAAYCEQHGFTLSHKTKRKRHDKQLRAIARGAV